MDISRGLYKGPITSLAYFNQSYFLAGQSKIKLDDKSMYQKGSGPYLSALDTNNFEKYDEVEILKYRVIHGILIESSTKKVCVYGQKAFNTCEWNHDENKFNVNESELVELDDWIWTMEWLDMNHLGIVCAHNQFYTYDLKSKVIINSTWCTAKCMLYSAKILIGTSYIASGTIYNEILIWNRQTGEVLNTLKGHDGVIFNIGYDHSQSLLYSVSDDRCIIIWNIVTSEVHQKFYGHDARVWKCEWLRDKGNLYLCSIGEDLKCCIWSINEKKLVYRFNAIRKGSKNIWSLCINEVDLHLITGWGDGGLRRYELQNYLTVNDTFDNGIEWSLKCENNEDYPRNIQIINSNIIACTNQGHVILTSSKDQNLNLVLFSDNNLVSYNCMSKISIDTQKSYLVIGTLKGQIHLIYNFDKVEIKTIDCVSDLNNKCKIFSLIWYKCNMTSRIYLSVSLTFLNGLVKLYELDTISNNLVLIGDFTLPSCKHRWLTGFALNENYFIGGDKCGNLHVFDLLNKNLKQTLNHVTNQSTALTAIYCKNDGQVICCSKDGFYRLFRFDDDLTLIGKYEINSCIDIIESILFDESLVNFDLEQHTSLALCFYGDKFLLWSFQLNRALIEVKCGGANRSWDYEIVHDASNNLIEFKFAYLKQKSIIQLDKQIHANELHSKITSKYLQTFHGNNIACCKYFNSNYFITGSEDTQVIVTSIDRQVSHVYHLQGHDSVVKCLGFINLNLNETMMVSAGGKANMKIWRIKHDDSKIEQIEQLCEFKRFKKPNGISTDLQSNSDVRFMDVALTHLDNGTFILYFACSDGFIRVFKYSLITNKLLIIDQCSYDRCLLCLKYIEKPELLIYVGTDGHLTIHRLVNKLFTNKDTNKVIIKNIHQSGINSIDVLEQFVNNAVSLMIVSVGDDSRLSLTQLFIDDDCVKENVLIQVDMAHASSIMGIKFIDKSHILTVSKDQRLVLWYLDDQLNLLIKRQVFFVNVMDVSSMDLIKISELKYQAVIVGCGFETFDLTINKSSSI